MYTLLRKTQKGVLLQSSCQESPLLAGGASWMLLYSGDPGAIGLLKSPELLYELGCRGRTVRYRTIMMLLVNARIFHSFN